MGETKLNNLPYREDSEGNLIRTGQSIVRVLNSDISSSKWTPISIPKTDGIACKAILSGMRDASNWKLSMDSEGSSYRTVVGSLALDIAKEAGEILFFVQSSEATGVIEVVLLD